MSVTIGSKGIYEDNSTRGNLKVEGGMSVVGDVTGVSPGKLNTQTLSGGLGVGSDNVTAATPGFYFVHNQSTCSIAKASNVPGAEYVLSVYWGSASHRCVVTASTYNESKKITFVLPAAPYPSKSFGSTILQGQRLILAADGSVVLRSDGYYWLVQAATGSLTIE